MGSSHSGWWLARPAALANFPLIIPGAANSLVGRLHVD
jgi:hypothetical protein